MQITKKSIFILFTFLILISCSTGLSKKDYAQALSKECKKIQNMVDLKDATAEGKAAITYWNKVLDYQNLKSKKIQSYVLEASLETYSNQLNSNNKELSTIIELYINELVEKNGVTEKLNVEAIKYILLDMQKIIDENKKIYKKLGIRYC